MQWKRRRHVIYLILLCVITEGILGFILDWILLFLTKVRYELYATTDAKSPYFDYRDNDNQHGDRTICSRSQGWNFGIDFESIHFGQREWQSNSDSVILFAIWSLHYSRARDFRRHVVNALFNEVIYWLFPNRILFEMHFNCNGKKLMGAAENMPSTNGDESFSVLLSAAKIEFNTNSSSNRVRPLTTTANPASVRTHHHHNLYLIQLINVFSYYF